MSHASRMEVAKKKAKKRREQRDKQKYEWNQLEQEEKDRILKAKAAPKSLKEQANIIIWDYDRKQIPFTRYSACIAILSDRLKETDCSEEERKALKKILGEMKC